MDTKETLHRLVDELPDRELEAAKRILEYLRNMTDPVLKSLMEAPLDDEPTSIEEDEGVEVAWQEYLSGKAISADEARRELQK